MKVCPTCGDEFEDHVATCPDHDTPLVAADQPLPPPPPAEVDAVLGRFHPSAADVVVTLLERKGVPYATWPASDETTEVQVPEEHRGDLRAELMFNWLDIVSSIPEEERLAVTRLGGMSPGWHDAPEGAWVDREGRVQVTDGAEDEDRVERERSLGPAMTLTGVAALAMGWYLGGDASVPLYVAGAGLVGVGIFTPR